ncbi:MAG: glycosyltransferase family A protein, partial [Candidatus Omnitrophica bacterium]|nr:glycosyltransferase family A protein [Candidatus Omnitrophota bacterium]
LDSVYAQSYQSWEIIFWDNASTDGSGDNARSCDSRLRYFKNEQATSLGEARNLAMKQARGKYIAFLDCDDLWLENKLEKQVYLLEKDAEVDFVYSNYFRQRVPEYKKLVLTLRGKQAEGDVFGKFLINYPVGLLTVILRAEAIKKANAEFDGSLELSEEFDFFMRILFRSKVSYIDEPLAIYRIHPNMLSRKLPHRHPFEMQYTLHKLKQLDASIQLNYPSEIKYYEAKLGYWYSKVEMEKHNRKSARAELAPFKFRALQFFVLYILTYLPASVWRWFHRYK